MPAYLDVPADAYLDVPVPAYPDEPVPAYLDLPVDAYLDVPVPAYLEVPVDAYLDVPVPAYLDVVVSLDGAGDLDPTAVVGDQGRFGSLRVASRDRRGRPAQSVTRPRRTASTTASVRVPAPSFAITPLTWNFAV
ncbi:MAG TPA: hypothetical protein VHE35_17265 [Kofleriaceae bacterium]|nr:hypothetical protein [Kofleriaceae bacterium]